MNKIWRQAHAVMASQIEWTNKQKQKNKKKKPKAERTSDIERKISGKA